MAHFPVSFVLEEFRAKLPEEHKGKRLLVFVADQAPGSSKAPMFGRMRPLLSPKLRPDATIRESSIACDSTIMFMVSKQNEL